MENKQDLECDHLETEIIVNENETVLIVCKKCRVLISKSGW